MALLAVCLLSLCQLISGLKFPVIGDHGDNLPSGVANQALVAQTLANWCASNTCDFIYSAGDNFYPQGVTSVSDSRFDSSWKDVYNQPSLVGKTWYQSIGNHDHDGTRPGDGRELFQVEYGTIEPRWVFPARYYDWVVQDPAGFSVHFVVVDTQSLRWGINDAPGQLQWLDETLAASTSEWRVVIAHHPPYSTGNYGPSDSVISADVDPILKRNNVHLLLSGHDHNLQHIGNATNINGVNYIISGGGGRGLYRYSASSANTLIQRGFVIGFFGYNWGFVDLEFTATQVTATYIDGITGDTLYSFTRGVSTTPTQQ